MSAKRLRGRGVLLLGVLLAAVCCADAALAAKAPPTIDEIEGVYQVKAKGAWYDFTDGYVEKYKEDITWLVEADGPNEVYVYIPEWDWEFYGWYENGIMIEVFGDPSTSPSTEMDIGYAVFSGKPGKVKMKGESGYSGLWDDYYEYDSFSGKMLRGGPVVAVLAGPEPDPEDDEGDEPEGDLLLGADALALAAKGPLSIDDILGTYSGKMNATIYEPGSGWKGKAKENGTWVVTKVNPGTVNIHIVEEGVNLRAAYGAGFLLVAEVADDSDIAAGGSVVLVSVRGKPGKVKMKGSGISADDVGDPDGEVEALKMSAKQIGP
ncbi:MAG: hypothetical protein GXY85_10720 [Candidatus Brocadiaceae bacterium]|nr:hypothetical protein [Candidatus Brocadiaceae bacterium]